MSFIYIYKIFVSELSACETKGVTALARARAKVERQGSIMRARASTAPHMNHSCHTEESSCPALQTDTSHLLGLKSSGPQEETLCQSQCDTHESRSCLCQPLGGANDANEASCSSARWRFTPVVSRVVTEMSQETTKEKGVTH